MAGKVFQKALSIEVPNEKQLMNDIRVDAERSVFFPSTGSSFIASLTRVLLAVVKRCHGISYAQGMSFLGAMVLYHVHEEALAFVALKLLLDGPLHGLYSEDFQSIKDCMARVEAAIAKYLPAVAVKAEEFGIPLSTVVSGRPPL